jgi:hypothetical protein
MVNLAMHGEASSSVLETDNLAAEHRVWRGQLYSLCSTHQDPQPSMSTRQRLIHRVSRPLPTSPLEIRELGTLLKWCQVSW